MRAPRMCLGAVMVASLLAVAPPAHAAGEPPMVGLLTENDQPERPDCTVERGTVFCAGKTFKHDYSFTVDPGL